MSERGGAARRPVTSGVAALCSVGPPSVLPLTNHGALRLGANRLLLRSGHLQRGHHLSQVGSLAVRFAQRLKVLSRHDAVGVVAVADHRVRAAGGGSRVGTSRARRYAAQPPARRRVLFGLCGTAVSRGGAGACRRRGGSRRGGYVTALAVPAGMALRVQVRGAFSVKIGERCHEACRE